MAYRVTPRTTSKAMSRATPSRRRTIRKPSRSCFPYVSSTARGTFGSTNVQATPPAVRFHAAPTRRGGGRCRRRRAAGAPPPPPPRRVRHELDHRVPADVPRELRLEAGHEERLV